MPRMGICTRYSNAEMLQQAGYSYVEEGVGKFLIPDKSDEEFSAILDDASRYSLPVEACNGFIPSSMKSVGPDAVHVHILQYMETAFKRAQQAGVEIIVFGSGGSRNIPEGFSRSEARRQFIDLCKQMAPIAKKYGVTVVLEPLNSKECNFVNSVAEGGEIVKAVNHPNFRLLADIYHMKMDNENPENIVKYGKLIKHVHIAEKQDRAVPGTYNEDFRPYFDALRKIDYKGRISIEAQWKDMQTQAPIAIETIKKQFNN
ncbi:MAG: sugar phosphate isomerase/epimerase [Dysgonomonadaceae bacterium]|nr:sugar phosphate isomerase/epimerase [Dysgonamonadaceae bacterium]